MVDPQNDNAKLVAFAFGWRGLLHLGDLSRWRTTYLTPQKEKRRWGEAVAWYEIATWVNPKYGDGHNGLGSVYLADESYLRAIYHLYRSLGATHPFPQAKKNLDLAYKKMGPGNPDPEQDLVSLFLSFHAIAHQTDVVEFGDQNLESVQQVILSRTAEQLRERKMSESVLRMLTMINLSAGWLNDPKNEGV
jgi:tetratricopeptide (TPR) repeat protein